MSLSWSTISSDVSAFVKAATSVVDVADPAAATVVSLATSIINGVIAAEPIAVSLYDTITSSGSPTDAQMQAYAAAELSSYNELMADIAIAQG